MRDYVHVMDVAKGFVAALNKQQFGYNRGWHAVNLGTGLGVTVLELIKHFETATGIKVPHIIADKRDGDEAWLVSDSTKANKLLKWKAKIGLP